MSFKKNTLTWLCMLVIGFVCPASAADKGAGVYYKGQAVNPERILVKYKNPGGAQLQANKAVLQAVNMTESTGIPLVPGLVILENAKPKAALQGANQIPKSPKEQQLELNARLKSLSDSGLFEYVEPDYIVQLLATPNDAAFTDGRLWGLRNTGQSGGTSGADINAVSAWNLSTGSPDVIVAVIDTGIRYTHRDLAANMWRNTGEIPNNGIDDDHDGFVDNLHGINAITGSGDPADDNGHGTHVAGTIGASADDGNPHVGVAWRVKLMGCKFLAAEGGGKTSDAIKCIDFAVSKGAQVLNNSWGGGGFSQALYDSIARSRDRGVLFVAAAGNEANNNDSNPSYPNSYTLDNIVSVAAINRQNQLASFSNFGVTTVDIAAPGVDIYSTWNESDTDYKTISGTSMAAPHVSGVAALLLSRFHGISLGDLKRALLNTATPVSGLQTKVVTGGRVNAFAGLSSVADGVLEVVLQPAAGSELLGGSQIPVRITVSDFGAVNGATITAAISGSTNVTFLNNGQGPDAVADDEYYTANLSVPPFQTSITLNITVSAPGKTTATRTVQYQIVLPPVNNDFEKRTIVTGEEFTVTGLSQHASKQTGEPDHAGVRGGKSVWYGWTAPASGQAFLTAQSSVFDTVLAVYTGSTLGSLTHVASNDDTFNPGTPNARAYSFVNFPVTAGVTYHFAVDGFGGDGGAFELQMDLATGLVQPTNDNFADRMILPQIDSSHWGFPATLMTFSATREPGEPFHAGNGGGKSVWFFWHSQTNGIVNLSTFGSNYDTLLAVYTGSSLNALTQVAANDDGNNNDMSSSLDFIATEGTTYVIAVDGYNGSSGILQMTLSLTVGGTGPVNDEFTAAIAVSGSTASVTGSNIGATKSPGEPNHGGNTGGKSVWWTWVPTASGRVSITTSGSSFDTLLGVYTGNTVGSLTTIASNDDSGGLTSAVSFVAQAGTMYRIAVDGYYGLFSGAASGSVRLNINHSAGIRPVNDDFANRIQLSGTAFVTNGINTGATKENLEPNHGAEPGGQSVWWSWTAPFSGDFKISTAGSSFDTLLGVYVGSSMGQLAEVAGNDDSGSGTTSEVTISAVQGVTYSIAVDSYGLANGSIQLRLTPLTQLNNIYTTTFDASEGYSVGFTLAGQNGWYKYGDGGNGIVNGFMPGFGYQAFVGFNPPVRNDGYINLAHQVPFEATPGQTVVFTVRFRILDSSNGIFDNFGWEFYNKNDDFLFGIRLNNQNKSIGYQLDNLVIQPTGYTFNNSSEYELKVTADFAANTWSAYIGGQAIVTSQAVSTTATPRNLGEINPFWSMNPANAGDNYMIFDNYSVGYLDPLIAPEITVPPAGKTVNVGDDTSLTVTVNGSGPLTYQWYHENTALPGATGATLPLNDITTGQAGRYWVVVSNPLGSVTSAEAFIVVNEVIVYPANDAFASRVVLVGNSNIVAGVSIGGTKEAGEPAHAGNPGGKSVWWTWTAPASGSYLVSTAGSDFDTLLEVYTGSAVNDLASIASNDDPQSQSRHATLRLNAVAGTTYQIAVDGYNGEGGHVRLTVKPSPTLAFGQVTRDVNGNFRAGFAAEPGIRYIIQMSTNLVNWANLQTVIGQDGSVQYQDPAGGTSQKFYRAVQEQ